ncbi:MAG: hypothetical protein HC838_16185, partial [Spirulinaceae cyanobacterium RM2_2_10]|nr:hypothetical protein [Spirulinaceae cyanobacterium RM2_2_10]
DSGELQIVKQRVASEGSETDRWFLRLRALEGFNFVHGSILQHIPSGDRNWQVIIYSANGSHSVVALDIQGGAIIYLWWLA